MDSQENNIILYGPRSGKALRRLYPELDEDPIFKKLAAEDVLFAWYVGIPGSPIDHQMPENVRYRTASAKCIVNNDAKKQSYGLGDFSEEVKQAIREFEKKSPEARLMAKKMTQDTFSKFQQLLKVDVDKDFLVTKRIGKGDTAEEITEMDWSGRKAYVDSATKIIEALPELVKKIEEGFGITETKKKDEQVLGSKEIDKYQQNKKADI